MRMLLLALIVLGTVGCDMVTMPVPPGQPQAIEAGDWNGIWLHEEAVLTLRVIDASTGRIEAAWVEEKGDRLVLETVQGQVRAAGDAWYGTMRRPAEDQGPDEPEAYLFARLMKEGNRIMLWTPSAAAFRRAVAGGELPGSIVDESVALATPDAALLEYLSLQAPQLFDWTQPIVLLRYRGD